MDRVTLRAGRLTIEVAPAVGGSIARFDLLRDGVRVPLMRGTDAQYDDVLTAACFPIVPFANRIRGGTFDCDGRTICLKPNLPGDPSPLHGQGWRNAWQVVGEPSPTTIDLVYEHAADEWPWTYEARQRIALDRDGLTIELSCRNRSAERMPCGLALHPYFPCDTATRLTTRVATAWTVDAQVLPVDEVPATGRYDLDDRAVCGQGLDNGFERWGGSAEMRWPGNDVALTMRSADAGRFQLYSPTEGGLFVAEPVQNANAALNRPQSDWADAGITMLAGDEECRLVARFDVRTDDGR